MYHHRNITLFYFWNTHVLSLFPSSDWLWENQIKKLEKHKNPSFRKSFSTSRKALVAVTREKKLVKVKPRHWYFLIIWKISNNIKEVKTLVIPKKKKKKEKKRTKNYKRNPDFLCSGTVTYLARNFIWIKVKNIKTLLTNIKMSYQILI